MATIVGDMRRRSSRVESPAWYRRRSAIFAVVFLIGFLGGWAISFAMLGRYEPAFATIGAHWGSRGPLAAGLVALALVFVAMSIRIWGSSYLSAPTVWNEEVYADELIVAGPFRFVRHPLYLANILLAVGFGAAAPLFGWIFIVVSDALFIAALIRFEDECLAARHGEAFQQYRSKVSALLPRIVPVSPRQAVRPSLTQGLRAESFTMFVLAGMVALFAVPRYGAFLLIGCYAAGVFVQRRIEHK